jgi:ectoine hydroxylase-related dioxygenase (phytanoyl-CoA dioxygenase family)
MIEDILKNKEGYVVFEKLIPEYLIASFRSHLNELYPVRASSSKKVYAEKDEVVNLEDISVWWSQTVENFEPVIQVRAIIDGIINTYFNNLTFYASDTVTINPFSKWISPHVDTPHRFTLWNYDRRLLGIQCIVALQDMSASTGATGVVPYSQKRDFDINKCYTGVYDSWFLDNCKQPKLETGSVLLYNCRVLHSSMPNPQSTPRPALLLNYLDKSIIDPVKKIDNIWTSNGKRP